MRIELKYGKDRVGFEVEDVNYMGSLLPNNIEFEVTGAREVARALENPIGTRRLKDIAKPGEKVVIITSDITRPMPSRTVLPPVINELRMAQVRNDRANA